MALRINTNVAALNAHKNMIKNDNSLSSSLEKLSSGLRINKAADDASGMAIADSLKSQALGLGQAIRNANDGISMVQTADGALDESINIVNTIKTKAIQAAQDGQTTESRKAIQSDINKLMEELDIIAKTTSFNNQKLLSGNFTNKKFQVGAYARETVSISIGSTESTKIGHTSTSTLTFDQEGTAALNIFSNIQNANYSLSAVEIAYDNTRDHSLAAVADGINKLSDVLGITAEASVQVTTDAAVAAGQTDSDFAINGVAIGSLTVLDNDANGALVAAINQKTDQHGVLASVDAEGKLTLTSTDGRAIEVTQSAGTTAVMGGTEEMSTLGEIKLSQAGTGEIIITDQSEREGVSVSTVDGGAKVCGASATTAVSTLTVGSVLTSGTLLASGSVIGGDFTVSVGGADLAAADDTFDSTIAAGSVLSCGTVIGSGTTIGGDVKVSAVAATAGSSTLEIGTVLTDDTYLESGTVLAGDMSMYLSGTASGAVVVSGGNTYIATGVGGASVKTGMSLTVTGDSATLASGSTIDSGSVIVAGSTVGEDLAVRGTATMDSDMAVASGTVLSSATVLAAGSVLQDIQYSGHGKVDVSDMTLAIASQLADESVIADGSSLGGQVTLMDDETVGAGNDMLVAKNSVINSGSTIAAGTLLTTDILADDGTEYKAGTVLEYDIVTQAGGAQTLDADMVFASGSILKAGTVLEASDASTAGIAQSDTSDAEAYRLADVDVTTQEGAQIAISVASSALQALDKTRSDLGSVQNQMTSTIANITTTRVNISAAESTIRDVDFAEESANFSKMQILSQASTFAMAQANASSQNVLSLLQ